MRRARFRIEVQVRKNQSRYCVNDKTAMLHISFRFSHDCFARIYIYIYLSVCECVYKSVHILTTFVRTGLRRRVIRTTRAKKAFLF